MGSQPTRKEQHAAKKAAKEEKKRQKQAATSGEPKRLFPKVSRKGAIAFCAVMVVLFVLSIVWRLGPGQIRAASTPTAQTTDSMAINAEGTTMVYKPGDYEVGKNLPAGEYKFLPASDDAECSVTLFKDGEPWREYVLSGQSWLTLEDGQAVRVVNGSFVKAADVSVQERTELTACNVYKVGVDCPAGTYTLAPTGDESQPWSHSWSVDSSRVLGEEFPVVQEGVADDPTQVTVEDGQYLALGYVTGTLEQ